MRKLVLLLVGFVLVAAACGGDEEPSETTAATETTAGSAVTVSDTTGTTSPGSVDEEPTTDVEATVGGDDEVMTQGESEVTVATEAAAVPEPEPEPIDAEVTLRALGPVRIGMTVDEAASEAGVEIRRDFGRQSTNTCYYVTAGTALRGVSIMVVDDRIARIEIDSPSTIATRSGVRIGTSADDLRQAYPDNIRQANDAVLEGEALAFVPNDDFDADYRIYFEIENGQVARYRLGTKPAVDYLRGCPEE